MKIQNPLIGHFVSRQVAQSKSAKPFKLTEDEEE